MLLMLTRFGEPAPSVAAVRGVLGSNMVSSTLMVRVIVAPAAMATGVVSSRTTEGTEDVTRRQSSQFTVQ
ncbi:hypothetical protein AMK12_18050 [Streptomyces sp. TSRI0395]|nr:hypothetical protein AMK12_18050 [Streptomyces sp. TSRI0395]